MNLSKNVKFLAISVVSIGTLYLGYLQFKRFQRRLTRLERDVRVIQSNIENNRVEQFVQNKPTRKVGFQEPVATTASPAVPPTTPTTEPVVKNINILKDIAIEDADIDTLNNEGLDQLEQLLENYETDESEYDSETVSEDDEEDDVVVEAPVETTTTETVVEPLKEIHILNQYIHLSDEELHENFSKNTCVELRELLKKCALSTGGKKEKLIQRLIAHRKSITSISSNE